MILNTTAPPLSVVTSSVLYLLSFVYLGPKYFDSSFSSAAH